MTHSNTGKDSKIFLARYLTIGQSHPTITRMNETKIKLSHLEEQTSQLLSLCQRLSEENGDLRKQLHNLTTERAGLVELKERARGQVEGMITRLRSMENV